MRQLGGQPNSSASLGDGLQLCIRAPQRTRGNQELQALPGSLSTGPGADHVAFLSEAETIGQLLILAALPARSAKIGRRMILPATFDSLR